MIEKMLSNVDASLLDVMKVINDNAMGISFIVDDKNKLCGVVTDGDIRRALLTDIPLSEKIFSILKDDFTYGKTNESHKSLIGKISDRVKIIPLVNDKREVVDYFEYRQNINFPIAIPNLNGNEFKYLMDAFLSSWISSSGEYITKFEEGFSSYVDSSFGVAVSNGTVALHLALVTLDVKEGDEVIIPDLTFSATINAVLHSNATPVIVDIEEDSWCIDPVEIRKAITPKTKAIIPVHLYGQVCNMDEIIKIAKEYNLKVIEDCAQAHGSKYDNKKVGSFGDIGCFSFFGNKIITTGEGGMCVTQSKILDEKMRVLRDHGMNKKRRYWNDVVGFNYRLTNLQASIGLAQLERIDEIHENRRKYEKTYKKVLTKSNFKFQVDLEKRERVTWLVSALISEETNRDEFISKLKDNGIDARPFFYPLSDMEIYKEYCNSSTPISHALSKRGLNLPTYESLKSKDEIEEVLKNVSK